MQMNKTLRVRAPQEQVALAKFISAIRQTGVMCSNILRKKNDCASHKTRLEACDRVRAA